MVFVYTKLLAIALRTIAIAIAMVAKKAIEYCKMQYMTPKKTIAIMQKIQYIMQYFFYKKSIPIIS